ncbi:MAG: hypothetical protein J5980_01155 [Muribaculaceae bacterium]|nr:hypothetical protein [Muribaculaceae bacterium]
MKNLSEGRKMFISVMAIFAIYATVFVVFEDFDRHGMPLIDSSDLHLLMFAAVTMILLAVVLYRYAHRMDERIRREQDLKQTETRRQMTQNISHELKTPVASIMGLTETILDNPQLSDDKRLELTRRTHAQAQRLSHLLQDISTLNRMDYASQQLEHAPVDISQLVSDIIYESDSACDKRQLTVNNQLPDILVIKGNKQLLYSIFRNLMDNAINYAGEGAIVSISAFETTRYWRFTFSDTGQGIPAEHLPHIFERFYRVDKGRSRSMGGTGLGLAIVKNAVLHHDGTIQAMKNQAGGLTIEFTLHK